MSFRLNAVAGCAFLGCLALATQAWAAAFALKEQGASGQGTAFAGATSSAQDLSNIFWNPAALGKFQGHQALAVASIILPRSEFSGTGSTATLLGSVPIGGGNGNDDIGVDAAVPSFYGLFPLTEDLKLGLAINSPWGLSTNNGDVWAGRYHAQTSRITTINVNPQVAYKVHEMLSVGAGVQIEYFDARLTNAVDFGSIAFAASMGACFPLCVPTARDGRAEFEADDEVGVGYNVGVLFEPIKGTRFGAAFRSMIHHDVQGDVDFFIPASVTSLPGGLGPFISATFADTGARTEVTLPEMVTFGVYHELNPQWAVMAEGQWTNWSRLEELRIQFDSGLPDNVTELEWEDSWYGALGVIFRPDHRWAFRAGVGFDESPVPDATRTPRLPDEDRIWLSAGAGMQVTPGGRVDLGYTHIFIDDASINLLAGGPTSPNFFRGNLTGEFESAVDIVAIQGSIAF